MTLSKKVKELINEQLTNWETAKIIYNQLESVIVKTVVMPNGTEFYVQFNPQRIISSSAKVDKASIEKRACFLCIENRPKEQNGIDYNNFSILINPYPIFKKHLTIVGNEHTPQQIKGNFKSMLDFAKNLDEFLIFYNGPKCGASAPDHFHFQAIEKNILPIEKQFSKTEKKYHFKNGENNISTLENICRKTILLSSNNENELCFWFDNIYENLKNIIPSDPEQMMNILAKWKNKQWQIFIFPRENHRPNQYFLEGEEQILFSPASVDFGGFLITPRQEDFNKMDGQLIEDIFNQVSLSEEKWEKIEDCLSILFTPKSPKGDF